MIAVNAEAVAKKKKKLLRGDSESICLLRYGETSPRAFCLTDESNRSLCSVRNTPLDPATGGQQAAVNNLEA